MKKLFLLLVILLLINSLSQAQSFRFRASVDAVQQSGFYRILLPPDVVGRLNDNLTDVRLYGKQEQEVPYLLTRQQPTQMQSFTDYELVSKQMTIGVATTLVVRKPNNSRINSLGVVLKNTNVAKKARLSGSADAQTWYAIDNVIRLGPSPNSLTTTDTQLLRFPLSDYAYYRLEINDSASAPLNILRMGNYTPTALAGTYSLIPNVLISKRDSSDKHTYIHLTRKNPARFDKLTLLIQSDTPYRRRAEFRLLTTRRGKRGRMVNRFETIRQFEISSADSNVAYLPGLKTNDLYVVIENADSPPLPVAGVRAYQLTTYLLANLTASQPYHLSFSADNLPAPAYDLTPFRANPPENRPIIGVNILTDTSVNSDDKTPFFQDSRVIWLTLSIILIVLGFFSYQMIQDMNKGSVR